MAHVVEQRGSEREVLSRISHELRTPLTSIIGYAEVMLSDPRLSPDIKREYVEIIRDAGRRLSNFLDNYFDGTFTERERKPRTRTEEDLSTIVQWSINLVSSDAKSRSVTIVSTCDEVTLANVNATHLVQILQNILANAIQLAPAGGRVNIRITRLPKGVEIHISHADLARSGISMSTVCQNFRWVQSPGVEIRENGLGLAFAKHVVELEGGELVVETHLDEGLIFKLQFAGRSASACSVT